MKQNPQKHHLHRSEGSNKTRSLLPMQSAESFLNSLDELSVGADTEHPVVLMACCFPGSGLTRRLSRHQNLREKQRFISQGLEEHLPKESIIGEISSDIYLAAWRDKQQLPGDLELVLSTIRQTLYELRQINPNLTPGKFRLGCAQFPLQGKSLLETADLLTGAIAMVDFAQDNIILNQEPEVIQRISKEFRLLDQLPMALANNLIYMVAQPVVNIMTSRVVSIELLSRWFDPETGFVNPEHFVRIAENLGLSELLIEKSLGAAAAVAKVCELQGLPLPLMTINITMADLIRNDFCDWFFSRVDHWHAPVDHLGLEISGKIDSWPHYTMVSNLRTLQESGIEIILDDFGTGPNNYESVWFLEPSRVKLSKRFTKELTATEDHFRGEKPGKSATDSLKTKKQMQGHFEIIHRLTETIGVAVIAKGVESPEQAQMLEDGGFIYAQGNFFHKPVELEQVASVIREQLVQTEGDSILAADQDPENMLSLFSDEELY